MTLVLALVGLALGAFGVVPASAVERPDYQARKEEIRERRAVLAEQWSDKLPTRQASEPMADELASSLFTLAEYWVGSNWGRGIPQSETPHTGKTNCGTFVASLLRDVGFVVDIKKLQRQPSQAIIRSFVGKRRIRKIVGKSMEKFLASVGEMGPGLFIIGLDLHVGLLVQTETELHYMHSSSETGKVVIEAASDAWTIQSSNYRVVGKILSRRNIIQWLQGSRIQVKGKH